jgi:SAM-dependent methyltransferase
VQKYIGADVSDAALANTAQKGLTAVKIRSDGTTELPDAICAAAVCSEVFEHLWDPLAAARELYRVLEPGGVVVVTVPNFGYFAWRLLALIHAHVPSEPESQENRYKGVHIRFFNQRMLKRLMKDAGFVDVRVYGWCGCRIWDLFWCGGPLAVISHWANRFLPKILQLNFLAKWWPNVFAERLRVVAIKPR